MMVLPRIYDDPFGNYPQHKGKPKMSYSQYTSWTDPKYKEQYIASYFLGIKDEGNMYAFFGGACGKYLEDRTVDENWLSEDDIAVLNTIHHPENSRYEVEIVVDRGDYVIQGFIDREYEKELGVVVIEDFKTGNQKYKKSFYGGINYQQTTLYAYQRELEGMTILKSGVILMDRQGKGTHDEPLFLSGSILEIPTPYSRERALTFLDKFDKVAKEVSDSYERFLNY